MTPRLDRTNLSSRLSLERLAAGALEPALASFLWDALAGIPPERIKDRESFDVADRLGLVWVWHGRVRVSQPSSTPCTRQRTGTASCRDTDKLLAHPPTPVLRTY